jgi:hypothetical protein
MAVVRGTKIFSDINNITLFQINQMSSEPDWRKISIMPAKGRLGYLSNHEIKDHARSHSGRFAPVRRNMLPGPINVQYLLGSSGNCCFKLNLTVKERKTAISVTYVIRTNIAPLDLGIGNTILHMVYVNLCYNCSLILLQEIDQAL